MAYTTLLRLDLAPELSLVEADTYPGCRSVLVKRNGEWADTDSSGAVWDSNELLDAVLISTPSDDDALITLARLALHADRKDVVTFVARLAYRHRYSETGQALDQLLVDSEPDADVLRVNLDKP